MYDGPACLKCDKPFKGLMLVMQNMHTGQWLCEKCHKSLNIADQKKYVNI